MRSMDYLENGILVTDGEGTVIYWKKSPSEDMNARVLEMAERMERKQSSEADIFWKRGRKGTRLHYENGNAGKHWLEDLLLCGKRDDIRPDQVGYRLYLSGGIRLYAGGSYFYQYFLPDIEQEAACPKGTGGNDFRGNLEHPCYTEDTDEIGIVTNSLGRMTERLNDTINQVYKIEIEKKPRS